MDLSSRSRKRSRDEDDDAAFGVRIEGVPADKKQRNTTALQLPTWPIASPFSLNRPSINRAHTLPFRLDHTAPPPAQQPPALFEPDESNTDSSNGNSPASFTTPDVDMNLPLDMDTHVSIAGSASPPSPFTQTHPHSHLQAHPHLNRPEKLNSPGLDAFAGRIPTPIHSNFNLPPTQPHHTISSPLRSRTDSFLPASSGQSHAHGLPRFVQPMKHILETDYAMPSPIAESPLIEDDDALDMADDMDMPDFPSSQLSRLSVSQGDGMMELDASTAWSQRSSSLDPGGGGEYGRGGLMFDVTPPTPTTPGRTGRARSGAFSASSTPQDKGGRRVVFGYREDCEKCRMRFPGHFAHFV